ISGQQNAFFSCLQGEMMNRNICFNFASDKNGNPGIQPVSNKLTGFNQVLPIIKANKLYFPMELKEYDFMYEFISELELATVTALKSKHDDAIDTISMLMYMKPYKPSELDPMVQNEETGMWELDEPWAEKQGSSLSSYIV